MKLALNSVSFLDFHKILDLLTPVSIINQTKTAFIELSAAFANHHAL
jgi:hypothetical protein